LTSEKYPSGKVFNYSVDDFGRLQTVADNQRQYLSSVSFNNKGLLESMNLGYGTSESFGYNDRFQMTNQTLNKGSQVLQKYDYGYGKVDLATGSIDVMKNNGQLGKITSFIGTTQQSQQRFDYDSIGRLSEAREYRGATNTLTYKEHFDFDRFGNLYRKAANNSTTGQSNPLAYTPIEDNQIEKSTNRFTSATGTTYNEAGMVVGDNKFRSMNFAYDANGRQVKATRANSADAWSVYDALGNRVGTKVNDVWQFVIYDAFGKLVAEYGTQGEGNGGVSYVLQDWQGSVRASVNNNGFIQARFDFTAFGEEVSLGVGMRSIEQGYSGDATTRQGYGLTEKDSSGLNHTWFRKQEQRAGRWTSPDPYKGSMSLVSPQSFNRYSYVESQPTNFVDPSGLQLIAIPYDCKQTEPIGEWSCRYLIINIGGGGGPTSGGGETASGGGGNPIPPPKDEDKCTIGVRGEGEFKNISPSKLGGNTKLGTGKDRYRANFFVEIGGKVTNYRPTVTVGVGQYVDSRGYYFTDENFFGSYNNFGNDDPNPAVQDINGGDAYFVDTPGFGPQVVEGILSQNFTSYIKIDGKIGCSIDWNVQTRVKNGVVTQTFGLGHIR
jgi:RHS repeat-associated protein